MSAPEESKLVDVERRLREAVAKAKAEGLTICSDSFGVVPKSSHTTSQLLDDRPFESFWAVVAGNKVCPLGAILKDTKREPNPEPMGIFFGGFMAQTYNAAVLLGITYDEAQSFVCGFDRGESYRGHKGPYFNLGQKLRDEFQPVPNRVSYGMVKVVV